MLPPILLGKKLTKSIGLRSQNHLIALTKEWRLVVKIAQFFIIKSGLKCILKTPKVGMVFFGFFCGSHTCSPLQEELAKIQIYAYRLQNSNRPIQVHFLTQLSIDTKL